MSATPPPSTPSRRRRSPADSFARALLFSLVGIAGAQRRGPSKARVVDLAHRANLAPRHMVALTTIILEGSPSISQLAEAQGVALSTASLLATQLVDAGLVVRTQDPHDRRRIVLSVHPEFHDDAVALVEARLAPLRRAATKLSAAERATVLRALDVVAHEVHEADESTTTAEELHP